METESGGGQWSRRRTEGGRKGGGRRGGGDRGGAKEEVRGGQEEGGGMVCPRPCCCWLVSLRSSVPAQSALGGNRFLIVCPRSPPLAPDCPPSAPPPLRIVCPRPPLSELFAVPNCLPSPPPRSKLSALGPPLALQTARGPTRIVAPPWAELPPPLLWGHPGRRNYFFNRPAQIPFLIVYPH